MTMNTPRPAGRKAIETTADLGILGSCIIVASWVLRSFFQVEMPADVQLNLGIVLMVAGGAASRLWRHRRLYGHQRPGGADPSYGESLDEARK